MAERSKKSKLNKLHKDAEKVQKKIEQVQKLQREIFEIQRENNWTNYLTSEFFVGMSNEECERMYDSSQKIRYAHTEIN